MPTWTTVHFRGFSARAIRVGAVEARALRVSFVGELGWELHVAMTDLPALHEALCVAGEPVGLRPFGAYAMNSMRLEKGYRAWGVDLTTERTPIEAGSRPPSCAPRAGYSRAAAR